METLATALLLAIFGALIAVSVLFSRLSERLGVPVLLLFLLLGMLAGSEGIGHIHFDNYTFAFRAGVIALILILFDGGLATPLSAIRESIKPASALATVGVAITAGLVALFARWLGASWPHAALLGAVVSSTDAAAVFAVLRGGDVRLKRRVATTLELESGLNDPMAVILTASITEMLVTGQPLGWSLLYDVPLQLAIGLMVGAGAGWSGLFALRKFRPSTVGLYPALTLAIALLAFGVATLFRGSGFLAVYVAAVLIGNSQAPYMSGLVRIHSAIAWLSQIAMFLMFGLLVFPSKLAPVAGPGLVIGLFLAFIARPIAVTLCLLPFRYPPREVAFLGWVGLRGAVPIILATAPVLAGVPGGEYVFNLVFFVVVVNAIVPGATIRRVTKALGLFSDAPPAPPAVLEINSTRMFKGDLLSFQIDEHLAVSGVSLSKLRFPAGSAVVLLVRGDQMLAARGDTVLQAGDFVYVFCQPDDRPYIELLFGRPEESAWREPD